MHGVSYGWVRFRTHAFVTQALLSPSNMYETQWIANEEEENKTKQMHSCVWRLEGFQVMAGYFLCDRFLYDRHASGGSK